MAQVNPATGRESVFDRTADYVSAAMGRPANIMIWLVLVSGANRSERNLELTLAAIEEQEEKIEDVQAKLSEELASNTALTKQVHELTSQIHVLLTAAGATGPV